MLSCWPRAYESPTTALPHQLFGSGSWLITGLLLNKLPSIHSIGHTKVKQERSHYIQSDIRVTSERLLQQRRVVAVDTSVEPAVPGVFSPPFDVVVSPSPAATSPPASVPPSSSSFPPFQPSSLLPPWHPAEPPSLSVASASQPPAGPCSPAPSVAISSS